jgi:hypothetical protein
MLPYEERKKLNQRQLYGTEEVMIRPFNVWRTKYGIIFYLAEPHARQLDQSELNHSSSALH